MQAFLSSLTDEETTPRRTTSQQRNWHPDSSRHSQLPFQPSLEGSHVLEQRGKPPQASSEACVDIKALLEALALVPRLACYSPCSSEPRSQAGVCSRVRCLLHTMFGVKQPWALSLFLRTSDKATSKWLTCKLAELASWSKSLHCRVLEGRKQVRTALMMTDLEGQRRGAVLPL